jgi:hypothetical protein
MDHIAESHMDRNNFMKYTKAQLIEDLIRWRKMYTASIKQTEQLQQAELDLRTWKDYTNEARSRLKKVREERDLALRLLALRLSKFTT